MMEKDKQPRIYPRDPNDPSPASACEGSVESLTFPLPRGDGLMRSIDAYLGLPASWSSGPEMPSRVFMDAWKEVLDPLLIEREKIMTGGVARILGALPKEIRLQVTENTNAPIHTFLERWNPRGLVSKPRPGEPEIKGTLKCGLSWEWLKWARDYYDISLPAARMVGINFLKGDKSGMASD